MKILVIDRDTINSQLVKSKLEALGHDVIEEPVKNTAIELLKTQECQTVFFDPTPLNNPRPIVASIRRSVNYYPYIVLMSQEMDRETALKSGANFIMSKPLVSAEIATIIEGSDRVVSILKQLGDDKEDFPSAGGVIAKSAFNQLFLSAVERADRYAEQSYVLFIGIDNFKEIIDFDGMQAASYSAARLSQYLVRLRRQSDIIAQTGRGEYCLLLQRPRYEGEPMEAAKRFAESLGQLEDITQSENAEVHVSVQLIHVPSGQRDANYKVTFDKRGFKQSQL